ncbi:uncharacterized protein METZ01_LOCUS264336, partial [marine metagenome]
MTHFLKIVTPIVITVFLTQSASGYDPSKHQREGGAAKQGGG